MMERETRVELATSTLARYRRWSSSATVSNENNSLNVPCRHPASYADTPTWEFTWDLDIGVPSCACPQRLSQNSRNYKNGTVADSVLRAIGPFVSVAFLCGNAQEELWNGGTRRKRERGDISTAAFSACTYPNPRRRRLVSE